MNTFNYKLDAILIALDSYYSQFINASDLYQCTGDASDLIDEFVGQKYISACLDFAETGAVDIRNAELTDLLKYLETEKLIISKLERAELKYKILPEGIYLMEKRGYVKKHTRSENEYKMKKNSIRISIAAFIISLATFIYTVFIKK